MTIKANLAELDRQHKALEHEIAEGLAHSSTDDLKIMELKRRKLILKDEIERVRHDQTRTTNIADQDSGRQRDRGTGERAHADAVGVAKF
jgi:hypothetical protein